MTWRFEEDKPGIEGEPARLRMFFTLALLGWGLGYLLIKSGWIVLQMFGLMFLVVGIVASARALLHLITIIITVMQEQKKHEAPMPFSVPPCGHSLAHWKTLIFCLCMIAASSVFAGKESRPFWTEKSSFIEGEDLYVVGVATNAKSVEEARRQAFENGRLELMNFAQVTSLEARGLVIETQMTYEEPNPNGTFTVYRLLHVPAAKLVAIQEQVREQTRVRETAIEKAGADLQVMQQTVTQKQQQLEMKSRQVQDTLNSVSRLQETLGQKATKIE